MCTGEQCNACVMLRRQGCTPLEVCPHGPLERHVKVSSMDETAPGMGAELDEAPPPCRARTETKPLAVEGQRIEIDLADADAAASFLEVVAKVIRARQRIVISIE